MGEKRGIVEELHKPARRNFDRRHVTIKGLYDLYQADLVEMQPYAKDNNGYRYMLTMIDAFSKKGWARPLKSKKGVEVAIVLKEILETLKKPPKFLQTDSGTEFFNKSVKKVLENLNINHFSSYSLLKASIVERFNRTLKTWMWKEFSAQGNYEWLSILEKLLNKYNSRVHRTIGIAPNKVNYKNKNEILKRLESLPLAPKKRNKFKVGDHVRISKFKHVFEKGYTPNWTTEIFIVKKVENTVPVTYKLEDLTGQTIEGGFYGPELLKTKYTETYLVEKILQRKNKQVFVKWLGFDDKFNEWINEEDLKG